ncbi:MAG: Cytochrome c-type biogenesis protein CcmE [Alphaproteobacteria bacterium MarineAlpha6_Bin6]|nr:cytochrome c maturation protein CcmE [Pelagibacteraceae bacterium]PPR30813.1 MAG: Cytochrome c-type biogenesis protein CcmE [Alphaproteobacteria bacterium MarineAlpha6_Bin6]PPR33900.1 MAG: Cytochrome c-type biogenesis protein CcmE [Alphaproteobacteria bacterium MarineAlpha6_Bin5]|tara:strand:+ start:193 stop:600 length:408 start_codon:yes stop_codon:yes gene_type:complete
MTPKKKRFYLLFSAFTFFCFVIGIILIVLQDNILFFYTPSEILQKNLKENEKVRLGGLVEENSVERNNIKINFVITDLKKNIKVSYEGILPDLFREGQGVIVKGFLKNNIFTATEVLAKHDENYMPPEIKKKLEN